MGRLDNHTSFTNTGKKFKVHHSPHLYSYFPPAYSNCMPITDYYQWRSHLLSWQPHSSHYSNLYLWYWVLTHWLTNSRVHWKWPGWFSWCVEWYCTNLWRYIFNSQITIVSFANFLSHYSDLMLALGCPNEWTDSIFYWAWLQSHSWYYCHILVRWGICPSRR